VYPRLAATIWTKLEPLIELPLNAVNGDIGSVIGVDEGNKYWFKGLDLTFGSVLALIKLLSF
jgi:hypothetical protein